MFDLRIIQNYKNSFNKVGTHCRSIQNGGVGQQHPIDAPVCHARQTQVVAITLYQADCSGSGKLKLFQWDRIRASIVFHLCRKGRCDCAKLNKTVYLTQLCFVFNRRWCEISHVVILCFTDWNFTRTIDPFFLSTMGKELFDLQYYCANAINFNPL